MFFNCLVNLIMSNYSRSKLKVIRSYGKLPYLSNKIVKNRKNRPGMHKTPAFKPESLRLSVSDSFRINLINAQKMRHNYSLLKYQIKKYCFMAKKYTFWKEQRFINSLEDRLDSLTCRLGFASSIVEARQLILHGHILVNGKQLTYPSIQCKLGDQITPKNFSTCHSRPLNMYIKTCERELAKQKAEARAAARSLDPDFSEVSDLDTFEKSKNDNDYLQDIKDKQLDLVQKCSRSYYSMAFYSWYQDNMEVKQYLTENETLTFHYRSDFSTNKKDLNFSPQAVLSYYKNTGSLIFWSNKITLTMLVLRISRVLTRVITTMAVWRDEIATRSFGRKEIKEEIRAKRIFARKHVKHLRRLKGGRLRWLKHCTKKCPTVKRLPERCKHFKKRYTAKLWDVLLHSGFRGELGTL